LSAREAVASDTPAAAATSLNNTGPDEADKAAGPLRVVLSPLPIV
jgi:hypothetical protein